jgi:response regulator RpfG family c-di-GMP phosphodiesterase
MKETNGDSARPPPGGAGGAATTAESRFNLLLVDDDDDLRATVRRALRNPQYVIHEASSGVEALDILSRAPIDAVITDFNMPMMNGLDLLQRVRISYPRTLRMMLTGQRDVELAVRALNEGSVHRFLLKPWDNVDLKGIVGMALRAHSP